MQAQPQIAHTAPISLSEYEAIGITVQHYINGGRAGRSEEMKLAFHPDATIFGYVGPELFAGPIQKLFDWVDQNPAPELQGRITSTDIVGTAATVRLELENWGDYRFTDYFTLLKMDGAWKILNKVFYLHP